MMSSTTPGWPAWKDVLPPPKIGQLRAEGGLRACGKSKHARDGQPLISYITVVRNGEKTIERTLASVRMQHYPHVEHIVLDGASTDGTLSIVRQHADYLAYFASEPDDGLYPALNKAIELAHGDLICVLNADDWLTPDAAQVVAAAWMARRHPTSLILSSAWVQSVEGPQLWRPGHIDLGAYLSCANACHNAMYATRGTYEASGPYATHLSIAADFQWVMRCIDKGVDIQQLDTPTTYYSLGGLSSNTKQHSVECVAIIQERFPYLNELEAWGLFHCFHTFKDRGASFPDTAPSHKGQFLHELTRRHAVHHDLLAAMALAGMEIMRHPQDKATTHKISRSEKARRSIRKRMTKLKALLSGN